ncbi:MAG: hypothetical protein HDS65_11175 [Bacteroidales bacterium]|nr:hypothetical protein [Bacteroidales bacterium]
MNKLLLSIAGVFFGVGIANADENTELRLNPEIDSIISESISVSDYPFIVESKNRISLNGDDWSALAERFEAAARGDSLFSIVYLGDSHVQADFNVDAFRYIVQSASRRAGRGLVIPFKLAGTNEPFDYSINLDSRFEASKLLKTPWLTEMPFTGIGLRPQSGNYTLSVSTKTPFTYVRFHHAGTEPELVALADSTISCELESGRLVFSEPVYSFSANFRSPGTSVLGGIELMNDTVGTVVHSIGNNGATYGSYLSLGQSFTRGLASLNPNLVIVALGTNEAFSRISAESMRDNIHSLITDIRAQMPDTKILMICPTECYKRVYSRRGKNRRRTSFLVVNTRVAEIRKVLKAYAAEEGIPFYDRYEVAGSAGAAAKLKNASLLSRDGIHFTAKGYQLWGTLLAKSFIECLSTPLENGENAAAE